MYHCLDSLHFLTWRYEAPPSRFQIPTLELTKITFHGHIAPIPEKLAKKGVEKKKFSKKRKKEFFSTHVLLKAFPLSLFLPPPSSFLPQPFHLFLSLSYLFFSLSFPYFPLSLSFRHFLYRLFFPVCSCLFFPHSILSPFFTSLISLFFFLFYLFRPLQFLSTSLYFSPSTLLILFYPRTTALSLPSSSLFYSSPFLSFPLSLVFLHLSLFPLRLSLMILHSHSSSLFYTLSPILSLSHSLSFLLVIHETISPFFSSCSSLKHAYFGLNALYIYRRGEMGSMDHNERNRHSR